MSPTHVDDHKEKTIDSWLLEILRVQVEKSLELSLSPGGDGGLDTSNLQIGGVKSDKGRDLQTHKIIGELALHMEVQEGRGESSSPHTEELILQLEKHDPFGTLQ